MSTLFNIGAIAAITGILIMFMSREEPAQIIPVKEDPVKAKSTILIPSGNALSVPLTINVDKIGNGYIVRKVYYPAQADDTRPRLWVNFSEDIDGALNTVRTMIEQEFRLKEIGGSADTTDGVYSKELPK